jgi:lysophospholipase L1-like esterase
MKQILFIITFLLFAIFIGCSRDDDPISPEQPVNMPPVNDVPTFPNQTYFIGEANFTSFVSLGNSITSGFQSGALFEEGQLASFPNLIYKQVKELGANTGFQMPIIREPGMGTRISVSFTSAGWHITSRDVVALPSNILLLRAYNNLAVPGAVLWIANGAANLISDMFESISFLTASRNNPLFLVILRTSLYGENIYLQAKSLKPTFITLWIGNNDVLGYATSGGTSPSSPTPDNMFQILYQRVIDSLLTTGAQIVVANIPDVSSIPYFKVGPPYYLDDAGNKVYYWGATKNGVRKLDDDDYLTMNGYSAAQIGLGKSQDSPLTDDLILDKYEVQIAKNSTNSFNQIINSICNNTMLSDGKPLPVVDVNQLLNQISNGGIQVGGEHFTSEFITGNTFSFDGIHPSNKGHAIIANEFIKVINSRYDANIPFVDVSKIKGIDDVSLVKKLSSSNSKQINFEPDFNEKFKNVLKLFQPN